MTHQNLKKGSLPYSRYIIELAEPAGSYGGAESQATRDGPSLKIRGGPMLMAVCDVFEEMGLSSPVCAEDRNSILVMEVEVEGIDQAGETELAALQHDITRAASLET